MPRVKANIEEVCRNSYRNFHVKGFDYLCLSRSEHLTRKLYFFGDNLKDLPELVMPHDHRYHFQTRVLAGRVANKTYRHLMDERFQEGDIIVDQFEYLTPLNGGDGFTWLEETFLRPIEYREYLKGNRYWQYASDIHTLEILSEGSIILIDQFKDVVPVGVPTNAYRVAGSRQPPNLSGLYDRMDEDYAFNLLVKLAESV